MWKMKSYKTDKIEELACLYEIAMTLNATLDLKKSLYNVLDILSGKMGMVRGTIAILSPFRDEISIEVAHGLSRAAIMRGKYKPGEGITGQVIQTGKAKVVPKISEEAFFLNRTASRRHIIEEETSFFVCLLKINNRLLEH
jgi:GAF domain.